MKTCPNQLCRQGRVPELATEDGDVNWVECPDCNGTGEVPDDCPNCEKLKQQLADAEAKLERTRIFISNTHFDLATANTKAERLLADLAEKAEGE